MVRVGPDPLARYLDVPASGQASGWVDVFNGNAAFQPLTGVTYEPGKIMIAGGVVENPSIPGQSIPVPTVRTLDMAGTSGWQPQPDMLLRFNHNLVTLPTGQVLATGGTSEAGEQSMVGVQCPQVWTPGAPGNPGTWTSCTPGSEDLALEPVVRNYHSTAILLPDGRVLTGGGEDHNPATQKLHLFCPPYLFNAQGQLAQRPTIDAAPASFTWGQVFTVCTANPAAITKVCLIRPPATTHTFDQNGRHITLRRSVAPSGPSRLFVTAPPSPAHAPPGDYMLFIVGSSDGPDVPSIARWVRLQSPPGSDACDVTPGATITDLTPDVTTTTSVYMTWTATADDATLIASGPSQQFFMRRASSHIDTEPEWDIAQTVGGLPNPGPGGTLHDFTVELLQPCTNYHFTMRAQDDKPQLSGFHGDVFVRTLCGGGGGGGFSARRALGTSEAVVGSFTNLAAATGTLVCETNRTSGGAWHVSARLATEADRLAASSVTVERDTPAGVRDTLGQFTPDSTENLLGLCSLRDRGRVAIPGFSGLQYVSAQIRSGAQAYGLTDARHSRLGDLGADFLVGGGSPELAAGDVLDLTYSPINDTGSELSTSYFLVRRQGSATPVPFSRR